MMISNKRAKDNQLLFGTTQEKLFVFLLLCVSGNPAFVMLDSGVSKLFFVILMVGVLVLWGKRIPMQSIKSAIWISLLLSSIFILQDIVLGYITVLGSINTIVKFCLAICLVGVLGARFKTILLDVLAVVSLISLPFYFLNLIGVQFSGLVPVTHRGESIIIYYQLGADYFGQIRNCGMFWEPGAFAGYIIITLSLFFNDLSILYKDYRKQSIILVIALLSTLSTTGFICLAFLIMCYFLNVKKSKFYSFLMIGIMAVPITFAFTGFSFLGDKINEQFVSASETEIGEVNVGRIGTILFDWHYIKKHPIIGNGLDSKTRYADHIRYSDNLDSFGNGFSGIIGDLGILFVFIWFCYLYKNNSLTVKVLYVIQVILILQGECFLKYPLMMSLPFINYTIIRKKNEVSSTYHLS